MTERRSKSNPCTCDACLTRYMNHPLGEMVFYKGAAVRWTIDHQTRVRESYRQVCRTALAHAGLKPSFHDGGRPCSTCEYLTRTGSS